MKKNKRSADETDIQIGKNIKAVRAVRGITQAQLGEALEMSFQQIQKYESGGNRVSGSVLARMAMIFEVPITYLFVKTVGADRVTAQTDLSCQNQGEVAMLKAFRKCPETAQRAFLTLSGGIVGGH